MSYMACMNCNADNTIQSKSVQLLILALTGQCNLKCSYCYAANQTQQPMTWNTAKQALQYITEYSGTPTIQFTGGEPLLAWELLVKCVEWLERHKIKAKLQIQTNATLLDDRKIVFIKKHQIAIGVSLDGFADSNAVNRPYMDFGDSTMNTIKSIQLLSSAGIEIGITTVVNAVTVDKLDKVIDLAYYLGNVRQVGFNLVRPQGRGKEEPLITEQILEAGVHKMLNRLEYWQNITHRSLIIAQIDKVNKLQKGYTPFSHCYALHKAGMYVSPDGMMYACASLAGREEYCLGHVTTGGDSQKESVLLTHLEPVVDMCTQCNFINYCGGACYSRVRAGQTINPLECTMKKIFIKYYQNKHTMRA